MPTQSNLIRTMLIVAASAAAGSLVAARYDEVTAALVFMLGVTFAGALGGLVCALIAAASAFLIFNFFITEPALTFRLATGSDLAPLVIFNLCAVVTGVLAGRLRDRSEAARVSNGKLVTLLVLSRALQSATRVSEIVAAVENLASASLAAKLSLFTLRDGSFSTANRDLEETNDFVVAQALVAADDGLLVDGHRVGLQLASSNRPVGVLVLSGPNVGRLDREFLDALRGLVTLALERSLFFEEIAERRAHTQAEKLKTALLSSVSHDFRTPLTAISASASSLLAYRQQLDDGTIERLTHQIVDECDRLNRYTANLLEMSRLESGVTAPIQVLASDEMISVAAQRVRGRAGTRNISLAGIRPNILVAANPALFELVLVNVLENAILYSDDDTSIEITSERDGPYCRIGVSDEGCGIPPKELTRVFDRFHRVPRDEASPKGSGLGLAIAKGFVEALGGSIEARTPGIALRGVTIIIRLPLADEM